MSATIVTSQTELDAALAANAPLIHIQSDAGVWLTVSATDSSRVVAWGSSSVEAWDSSHVVAWDSSHVVARDSSSVVARDSSRVEARDSSRVVARDSSRVVAWDSSSVVAWDSSSVVAWDSSRVVARDSSSVVAWDSSHVVARGSSSVVAWGSSSVVAWGSSRVEAGSYVAVHLHSQTVTLSGGVVIDMTAIDRNNPQTWCDLYGANVTDGRVTVYKGVDANLTSAHGTTYLIGETVTAPDWRADSECGHGLHFSPSPIATEAYCTPARYLECTVDLATMQPLGDKVKSPSCVVIQEVSRWRDPVAVDGDHA